MVVLSGNAPDSYASPAINFVISKAAFFKLQDHLNGSGCGSRTHYLSGYEPGMIFRFTHPQIVLKKLKMVAGMGAAPT